MEPRVLGAILVTVLSVGVSAQSSTCTNSLDSLSPCLTYIAGNDEVSSPSSTCCVQLGNAVETSPQCVCLVISGRASSLGINVNLTKALALPGACRVEGPPLSLCNGNSVPTGSSSEPSSPTGGGSNINPIAAGFSHGNSLQLPAALPFVVLLFVTSYLSVPVSFLWTSNKYQR